MREQDAPTVHLNCFGVVCEPETRLSVCGWNHGICNRADFPAYLWEPKGLPFFASPFWGIRKLVLSTDIRLVADIVNELMIEVNLQFCEIGDKKRQRGVRQ
jgi:hypothetical protein